MDIIAATSIFKLVNLIIVGAVVAVCKVLIVGLAEVEHELILAIDEHVGWLVGLAIKIETAA